MTSQLSGLWKLGSHGLLSASIRCGMDVPITYTCTVSASVGPAHLLTTAIMSTGFVLNQEVLEELTESLIDNSPADTSVCPMLCIQRDLKHLLDGCKGL